MMKNVAVLRFPEFKHDWVKTQLGTLLTFKNGINASKSQYGKGYKFINVLDIINNDVITYNKIIGSVDVSESEYAKNEVKYGDILFQRSSETREEVGQSNVYLDREHNATFGGFVIRGSAISPYIPEFVHYLLKTSFSRNEITTKSGGSTRYNVGQDTLRQVNIILPSLPEQQKIAAFLTAVDDKIRQLSKKKSLLEQYKKGLIQQIFSRQIRFKPDRPSDGDEQGNEYPGWEEKKLGELLKFEQPTKYLVADTEYDNSYSTPVLTAGKTFILGYTNESTGIFKDNLPVILFDDFTTATQFVDFPFKAKSSAMKILTPKEGVDIKFVYEAMQTIEYEIGGHGRHWISIFSQLKVQVPNAGEQTKIASFLSAIDDKINHVTRQIAHTRQYKKGLLQQMFV